MTVKELIEELSIIMNDNGGDCEITVNTNPYCYSFCNIDRISYDDDIEEAVIHINI